MFVSFKWGQLKSLSATFLGGNAESQNSTRFDTDLFYF